MISRTVIFLYTSDILRFGQTKVEFYLFQIFLNWLFLPPVEVKQQSINMKKIPIYLEYDDY